MLKLAQILQQWSGTRQVSLCVSLLNAVSVLNACTAKNLILLLSFKELVQKREKV